MSNKGKSYRNRNTGRAIVTQEEWYYKKIIYRI